MKTPAVLILSFIICLGGSLVGGCRSKKVVAAKSLDTPQAALIALLKAMRDADINEICQVVQATPAQREVIDAGVEMTKASYEFRDAFVAAYGKNAWAIFQDPAHRPGAHDAQFILIDDTAIDNASKAAMEINKDNALGAMPIGSGKVRFVAIHAPDGQTTWMVSGETMVPPDGDAAVIKKNLLAAAATVRKFQKVIGKEGITPSEIDTELGRSLDKILGDMDDSPHRFEIDKLLK